MHSGALGFKPFFRSVPGGLVVYGYINDNFYFEEFESVEEFEERVGALEVLIPKKPVPAQEPIDIVAQARSLIELAKENSKTS